MNTTLTIAIRSELFVASRELNPQTALPVSYLTLDIHALVDNHTSIRDALQKHEDEIYSQDYIVICGWLFGWFQKINHSILSRRIADSLAFAIYAAENARGLER